MQSNLDWNDPIIWLTAIALLLLAGVQTWLLVRNRSLPPGRKWVRAGLNGLLWLMLAGYFAQIRWPTTPPSNHALLIGADVPAAMARLVRDSLHVRDSFTARTLKTDYDSITLVGQDFPAETLTRLSHATLRWVPYDQPDRLQDLRWKGVVRRGEQQRITGRIQSSRRQVLAVRYGTQTLDSVVLDRETRAFSLQFPAFARGRTQTELVLQNAGPDTVLDTVRFFARTTRPLTVQFLLNNPDFESKTLADWLGRQGHAVYLSTTLSTNVSNSVSLNGAAKSGRKPPDIIITEPANAASATVRKAVADGRSVLFINLTNPETDGQGINRALGSRLQVRKLPGEVAPVSPGLNALPYQFMGALNQFVPAGYPVAVQRTTGRVGVSLLNETFPLSLSGDSVAYNRVWYAIMGQFQPADTNAVRVDAPVFSGLPGVVGLNNPSVRSARIRVGSDTVRLGYSPVNNRSAEGTLLTNQTGWLPVQDSLAIYVQDTKRGSADANRQVVAQFMRLHNQYQTAAERVTRQTEAKLPDWAWLLLFLACFTALWVEPKLR